MLNLANSLVSSNMQTQVIAVRTNGGAIEWHDAKVPLIDLKAKRTLTALPKLILQLGLTSPPPDILFSTMVDANIAAWIASRTMRPKPKLVLRETNSHRARGDVYGLRRKLVARAYRSADLVVALSEGVRQELVADYSISPERAVTIHNPVRLSSNDQVLGRPEGMPPGRIVLGVGRLVQQKNFALLVRALVELPGDVSAVILGEGPERAHLVELAKTLGIENRLHLPGHVKDTRAWLCHADIFALTSRWEGFGHVIVEAMDACVPVISTDCPHGPRDIISDQVNGYLTPNGDVTALAIGLNKLFLDKEYAARLACAGKLRAQDFEADRIAGCYLNVFHRLISSDRNESQ